MKQLLRTSSVSFAEGLRLALEAEEIAAIVSNENAVITPTAITVSVLDDADYDRAREILRSLETTSSGRWFANRRLLRLLVAAALAVAVAVCLNL